ncbi:unnamed protein product [Owenia fusiformis]|uniref:GDP-fucose protein O-fucosyltransferase 1 n=1 Tax=Owenia fusiformis TaxID=6347 RepID=A0A8J1TRF7_OWEFU|nr:unnamed protein product [Owenia fusiformis]
MAPLWSKLLLLSFLQCVISDDVSRESEFIWDVNGYVIFCPCMGRFGNQADHYLGGLAFAKSLNRTLILPPWRTYKNVPFDEWFKVEQIRKYHRVILADDFMKYLAPKYWPVGKRIGWCWLPSNTKETCKMKEGNPFGPFWDGLGVDFDEYMIYQISFHDTELWRWGKLYPPADHPVMAFKGAPARFPIQEHHVHLQQYLEWSDAIEGEAQQYVDDTFHGEPYVGIHLRNGGDWVNACAHVEGGTKYMASPQCMGYQNTEPLTKEICYPSEETILRQVKNAVLKTNAKHIFVATDKNPMIKELEQHLKEQKVKVHHLDPWLPLIDLAILGKSDHFIGNCVSSFTAFVKRHRDVHDLPSSFWSRS